MRHPVVVWAQYRQIVRGIGPAVAARQDVMHFHQGVPGANHAAPCGAAIQAVRDRPRRDLIACAPIIRIGGTETRLRGGRAGRPIAGAEETDPRAVPRLAYAVGLDQKGCAALPADDGRAVWAAEFGCGSQRGRLRAVCAAARAIHGGAHLGRLAVDRHAAIGAGRGDALSLLPAGGTRMRAEHAAALRLDLTGKADYGCAAGRTGIGRHTVAFRGGLGKA